MTLYCGNISFENSLASNLFVFLEIDKNKIAHKSHRFDFLWCQLREKLTTKKRNNDPIESPCTALEFGETKFPISFVYVYAT